MSELKSKVESMIAKAEKADKSEDALRFSQAALNAANAMCSLGGAHRAAQTAGDAAQQPAEATA